MFKKLLKYDLSSVGRIWWILGLSEISVFLVAAIVFRICVENLISSQNSFTLSLSALTMMLAYFLVVFAIAIFTIGTEVLIYVRFYKHLFSDEGYLTFTLPVTRRQVILSKTVNAVVWMTAELTVVTVGAAILMLVIPPMEPGGFILNTFVYRELGKAIAQIWSQIGGWLIVYTLEGILLTFVLTLSGISLIQFCITMGAAIVKKLKLLLGIGIYYAVNSFLGVIIYVFSIFFTLFMGGGLASYLADTSTGMICAIIAVFILMIITMVTAFTAVFYFATLNLVERKLNLA